MKTYSGHGEVLDQILTIRVGNDFLSKFISILRESRNDHNSRTSSTHNTNDLLEPQGLSATIQIQVDSEDKQIKQNAMQIYIDMPNTANV